jgi:cbb3-type cytochrome oxidase subunit 1
MQGLSTQRAPHPSVVLPHFAFGAFSFLFLSFLMLLSGNELTGHYFNGKILAITHVATLGWITMVIFGALYQLIPVVMEVALYSEKLAKINFTVFAVGIVLLVYTFWISQFDLTLLIAATFLLIAVIMFSVNVILTAKSAEKWNIESSLIVSAVFWLFTTALLGFLISVNFKYVFLPAEHIAYLKAHAHSGMVGWFLLLIIGVGSSLLPMFFLSHALNRKRLHWAFYLVNAGTLIFFVDTVFIHQNLFIAPTVLVAAGIFAFMLYVYQSYKKRARKNLDVPLKHTVVSIVLLFVPIILAFFISLQSGMDGKFVMRVNILYVMSILLGFITSLILGQAYKTLPFIIWLQRYQKLVGKVKTPLPKDLYSEKVLNWQYWSFNLTVVFLFGGMLSGLGLIIQTGSIFLLLTAVFYNINIYKMYTHKIKTKKL